MVTKGNNNKKNGKKCFIIAPIGEPKSDVRKRSDQVFKHIISPAVVPLGYSPIRADQISEPGIITSQIIEYVAESELVIADLSGHNPNVFYELAIRHAIKKPLIQLIQKGEKIPFDVASMRIIQFDLHDLDSVEFATNELEKNIKNVQKGKKIIDTPISVALDLKALRQSEKPLDQSYANLLGMMNNISNKISDIDSKISLPKYTIGVSSGTLGIGGLSNKYYNNPPKNLEREWDSSRNKYIWVEKDDSPSLFKPSDRYYIGKKERKYKL